MRFFCTCDCKATAAGLANALEQIERLERTYAELNGLYHRLQGRYAREFRGDGSEPGATKGVDPEPSAVPRDNPRALELLTKRGR